MEMADHIAKELLSVRDLLPFTLRQLGGVRKIFSKAVRRTVEDGIEKLLLAKSPAYREWFANAPRDAAGRPIITAKVYSSMEHDGDPQFVLSSLRRAGYKLVAGSGGKGKSGTWEKIENGVRLRILYVDISHRGKKDRINIFRDMADPKIHYIAYNGHAGMGGNLEMRVPFKGLQGKKELPRAGSHRLKLVQIVVVKPLVG